MALGPVDDPPSNPSAGLNGSEKALTAQVDKNDGSGGPWGDGIIEWICSELRESVYLELAYDISAPVSVRLTGI